MRGYLLTPARHPQCTTIYWFDQPKRQNETLPYFRRWLRLAWRRPRLAGSAIWGWAGLKPSATRPNGVKNLRPTIKGRLRLRPHLGPTTY
jgi:hypothetical protein